MVRANLFSLPYSFTFRVELEDVGDAFGCAAQARSEGVNRQKGIGSCDRTAVFKE